MNKKSSGPQAIIRLSDRLSHNSGEQLSIYLSLLVKQVIPTQLLNIVMQTLSKAIDNCTMTIKIIKDYAIKH